MPDQQRDVALKRAWLQERIDAFQRQVANILQSALMVEMTPGMAPWEEKPILAQNLMESVKKMEIMRALHLPKSMIKYNYSEIILPMAV